MADEARDSAAASSPEYEEGNVKAESNVSPEWTGGSRQDIMSDRPSLSSADDNKALLSDQASEVSWVSLHSWSSGASKGPVSSAKLCLALSAAVMVAALVGFLAGAKDGNDFLVKAGGSPCNEDSWPDKANGLVCGSCKVPVAKFNYFYETCSHYCNIQGRTCVGGWRSEGYCEAGAPVRCDESPEADVTVCQCSVEVSEALRGEFSAKAKNKVNSSCGKDEADVVFSTDAPLATVNGISSAESCRSLCVAQKGCGAFTWARSLPGLTNICFLKKVTWGHKISKSRKLGVYSGHPYTDCTKFEPSHYYSADGKATTRTTTTAPSEFSRWQVTDDGGEEQANSSLKEQADGGLKQGGGFRKVGDIFGHADGGFKEMEAILKGVIRAKHGVCLGSEWPHHYGSQVEMMTCNGEDSQEWTWAKATGQLFNKLGLCLSTDTFSELSGLRLRDCDTDSWNQQFSFKDGNFRSWRGPCINADEYDRDHGGVFLRPCDAASRNQQFEMGALSDMSVAKVAAVISAADVSMYCFALMLPHTYEQGLLAMQYQASASLFSCDAYSVYSNMSIKVAHGLTSRIVDSNLVCGKGGEFKTALNLHIFIAVWKRVKEDAVFMQHDWTVKVDPDAVFFPQRLKGVVALLPETEKGVYLNNCKFGLHGPIEVFSRNAVISWTTGYQGCMDHFWQLCHGDCLWGEDLFIDQCLYKVLGARRENDYRILFEDHCDPPPNWQTCDDLTAIGFHPFKELTEYRTCLNNNARAVAEASMSKESHQGGDRA